MAKTSASVRQAVRRFARQLQEMGIQCERLLLYGSQASGTAVEGSDIDLIVISPAWAAYSERERLEILGIAAARILEPIQARGATPEEIATYQISPFLDQVLREQAVVVA
jgi:predicted nucleotidyltransferase